MKVEKAIKIPNHMCLSNKRFGTDLKPSHNHGNGHHKHTVVVHDIGDEVYEDPAGIVSIKIVYMVAEMLPGGSLQDRIDDHDHWHPQPQALDAAIAMVEGLGYAHQNNVVHRHVKLITFLLAPTTPQATDSVSHKLMAVLG